MRTISMPDPAPCDVVVSRAGHDAGRLYLVVAAREGRLLLCDGRLRRLANPKCKSPRHVRVVFRGSEEPGSDRAIRLTLAQAALDAAAKEELLLGER